MNTERAIELAGGRKPLAELLGISLSAISQWGERIPDNRVWQLRVLRPGWFDQQSAAEPQQKAA